MREAFKLCSQTRRFSHMFDEELEMTCKKYEFPVGEWFIRSERVSLKTGCYGCGPYTNIEMVVKSMVTCIRGHQPHELLTNCDEENNSCILYLIPWLELDSEREFRIFVYNNKITAFSIQNIYSVNEWLNSLTDDQIINMLLKIKEYFELEIKEKMEYMTNYTMDLALLHDSCYFIEPNSFGKEYAAGSALYHWIKDEYILLSLTPTIELRYVSK